MHDGLTLDLVICAVFTPFVNIIVMTAVWGIWGFVIGSDIDGLYRVACQARNK